MSLQKLDVLISSLKHLRSAHLIPAGDQLPQLRRPLRYPPPPLPRRDTLRRHPRINPSPAAAPAALLLQRHIAAAADDTGDMILLRQLHREFERIDRLRLGEERGQQELILGGREVRDGGVAEGVGVAVVVILVERQQGWRRGRVEEARVCGTQMVCGKESDVVEEGIGVLGLESDWSDGVEVTVRV